MKFIVLTTFLYFLGSYINISDAAVNQFIGGILSVLSSLLLLSFYFIVLRGVFRFFRNLISPATEGFIGIDGQRRR